MFDDEFTLAGAVSSNRDLVGIMLKTSEINPFDNVTIIPIDEVPENWHAICLAYDTRVRQSDFAQKFINTARDFATKRLFPKTSK